MILTIGMPSYDNHQEVWSTIQGLKVFHDLSDVEIMIVDNKGSALVEKVVHDCHVRYEKYTKRGTGPVRNKIFELASGEFVLCIDSHIFLYPDTVWKLKQWYMNNKEIAKNLITGTIVMSDNIRYFTHYENKWRSNMWGIWPFAKNDSNLEKDAFEIEIGPLGLFGCRKDSWLGFAKGCTGFGGVEGVLQEKYRKSGRKCICLPWLKWVHFFHRIKQPYPNILEERIKNFILGFKELSMNLKPLYDHFGEDKVKQIEATI